MGLDQHYLNVAFDEFVMVSEKKSDVPFSRSRNGFTDVVTALSEPAPESAFQPPDGLISGPRSSNISDRTALRYRNAIPVLISTAAKEQLSASTETALEIRTKLNSSVTEKWLTVPYAFVTKLPGYLFSSYSATLSVSPMIVSMDGFEVSPPLLQDCP